MSDLKNFLDEIKNGTVVDDGFEGAREFEMAWENTEGRTVTQTVTSGFGEKGAIEKMRELLPSTAKPETLRIVREIVESHF